MRDTFVIGDVHGHPDAAVRVLARAGLLDDAGAWTGGDATLWFIGDLCDRGPDGVGAVELVMRLEAEAADAGGRVGSLMGNHEVYLLSAYRFGGRHVLDWIQFGGTLGDLERLKPEHAAWLERRPALALEGDTLLVHADATFYFQYGSTIERVNEAMGGVVRSPNPEEWTPLIRTFADRHAFREKRDRAKVARRFAATYGAARIVHGHTPIFVVTRSKPSEVTGPLVYAEGVVTNVDHAIFAGGPGFVVRLT